MTLIGWLITIGTLVVCFQIGVVLVCWRLGAMRDRAVAEGGGEAHAEPPPGPSVWDALDRHLQDVPAEVLVDEHLGGEHEADADLSEENEAYLVDFVAWGAQCADLEDLAARLDAP